MPASSEGFSQDHGQRGFPPQDPGTAQPSSPERKEEPEPRSPGEDPMKAVGLAWAFGFACGILLFILTKREVDRDRLKQMKARQNMRAPKTGEYERQRSRASSQHAPPSEAGSGVQA